MYKKILALLESDEAAEGLTDADRASLAAEILNHMAEADRTNLEAFFKHLDADVHTELCGVAAEEDEREAE